MGVKIVWNGIFKPKAIRKFNKKMLDIQGFSLLTKFPTSC